MVSLLNSSRLPLSWAARSTHIREVVERFSDTFPARVEGEDVALEHSVEQTETVPASLAMIVQVSPSPPTIEKPSFS